MTWVDGILRQNQSYEKSGGVRVWILKNITATTTSPWLLRFIEAIGGGYEKPA